MQVSYYNTPAAMYRHQQAVAAATQPQFHSGSPMHSWYPGYHTQGGQGAPAATYCMQEEQQMWHHPAHHPAHMYHQEFNEFVHGGGAIPQLQQITGETHDSQLPSPPITVSGSEMSSPGTGGNISPANTQNRPTPARSPYEWIKKTSYQTQPNPGKTRTKDKYRVVYTDHQRLELEKEFNFNNKYITIRRKCELSANLGLSERQIKIWFQNRRAKERKLLKKRFEEVKKENPDDKSQLQELQHSNIDYRITNRISTG
ncbi:Homeodomain [Popillia japonica]|uniref:Homeodomain n=1 Tax=Popillia japonica TaxID=7064 RepID=A0AAW1JXC8_POPJA